MALKFSGNNKVPLSHRRSSDVMVYHCGVYVLAFRCLDLLTQLSLAKFSFADVVLRDGVLRFPRLLASGCKRLVLCPSPERLNDYPNAGELSQRYAENLGSQDE